MIGDDHTDDAAAPAPMRDADAVAAEIEGEMFEAFSAERDYTNKLRSLVFNFTDKKNVELPLSVLRGEIDPREVCHKTSQELASDKLKKAREIAEKNRIEEITTDTHWKRENMPMYNSLLKCPRCKQNKVEMNERQTRSADEPTTKFCLCTVCGKRWRFC